MPDPLNEVRISGKSVLGVDLTNGGRHLAAERYVAFRHCNCINGTEFLSLERCVRSFSLCDPGRMDVDELWRDMTLVDDDGYVLPRAGPLKHISSQSLPVGTDGSWTWRWYQDTQRQTKPVRGFQDDGIIKTYGAVGTNVGLYIPIPISVRDTSQLDVSVALYDTPRWTEKTFKAPIHVDFHRCRFGSCLWVQSRHYERVYPGDFRVAIKDAGILTIDGLWESILLRPERRALLASGMLDALTQSYLADKRVGWASPQESGRFLATKGIDFSAVGYPKNSISGLEVSAESESFLSVAQADALSASLPVPLQVAVEEGILVGREVVGGDGMAVVAPENGRVLYVASENALYLVGGAESGFEGLVSRYSLDDGSWTLLHFEATVGRVVFGAAFQAEGQMLFVLEEHGRLDLHGGVEPIARLVRHHIPTRTSTVLWEVPYLGDYQYLSLTLDDAGRLILLGAHQASYQAWLIEDQGRGIAFIGHRESPGEVFADPAVGGEEVWVPVVHQGDFVFHSLSADEFGPGVPCMRL